MLGDLGVPTPPLWAQFVIIRSPSGRIQVFSPLEGQAGGGRPCTSFHFSRHMLSNGPLIIPSPVPGPAIPAALTASPKVRS